MKNTVGLQDIVLASQCADAIVTLQSECGQHLESKLQRPLLFFISNADYLTTSNFYEIKALMHYCFRLVNP